MHFACGGMQISELPQNGSGIEVVVMSTGERVLLSNSVVCGCNLIIQRYVVLSGDGKHCVVEISNV